MILCPLSGISGSVRICSGGISGAVSSPHAGSIIFMMGNSAGGVGDYGQTITYTEQMRLNNSGYLGIGTTAPISSLHINSPTTNGNALYIEQDNSSMSNFINLTTNANAGKMYIGMDNSGGIELFGSGVAYAASIGTPNATALVFATNNIV